MKGYKSKVYKQMVVVFIVCFLGIAGSAIYMFITDESFIGKAGGRIRIGDVTLSWLSVAILALIVLIAGLYILKDARKDLNGK